MSTRKLASYFIPTVADILFLSIALTLLLLKGQDLLSDCDTGFHIRTGDYIINTFSVPKFDLFSHISPTLPWTAHEWLAELIMGMLHNCFGMAGNVAFFSLLIALVYYLLMRHLRSVNGNLLTATIIIILVTATSQVHWLARPHIFSLLIMVIWYRILDDYQYRENDRLVWLPVMMLLWVNLHGGFLAGFILSGIYCAGNFLESLRTSISTRTILRGKSYKLLKISLLSLLASLVNPIGYNILLFPFNLVGNRYIMDHVAEFQSPNFHDPIVFKYLLLLSIGLLAFSRKRLNLIELMLLLIFSYMALFSARYIPLFALIISPIIMSRADDLINSATTRIATYLREKSESFSATEIVARGFFWPIAGCMLAAALIATNNVSYSFDEEKKPVAAVEFIKKERIEGNMFNNDEFGDYIIYAAWPQYRVFFDGRSDMYGAEQMKEYDKIIRTKSGWEDIINKYDIDWIFFDAQSALSRYLLATSGWRLIYADKVAHIFVKDIPKYQSLIKRYSSAIPLSEIAPDK
jgi:hypothetical protein